MPRSQVKAPQLQPLSSGVLLDGFVLVCVRFHALFM
jgi:hypothetical protein